MRIFASGLAIALGLAGVGTMSFARSETIGFADVVVAQNAVDARKVEADRLFKEGSQQFGIRQFEAALQPWQKSLMLYRDLKDRRREGLTLSLLGSTYYCLGKHQKAIELHEQSLAIARELKDRNGEGISLGSLGLAYNALGKYSKAIEFYEQKLTIVRELKDRSGEGDAIGSLGLVYLSSGKYQKAIDFFEQSLAIARELKDRSDEGKALSNLGLAYFSSDNHQRAIEFNEQSLAIARELKDRDGEGTALLLLGMSYLSLGNYPKVIELQEQSLAIMRERKDRPGEGIALGILGVSYLALDNYPKAIEFNEQYLVIAREIKDRPGEGIALSILGSLYLSLGNYPKAIEFNEQYLVITRERKDRIGEGSALGALGSTYTSLGNYPKAIEFHEQGLAIMRERKNRMGEGKSLDNLGIVYFYLLNYSKAIELQEQSLAIAREVKDRTGEEVSLGNLGISYGQLGSYIKAVEFQKQRLVIARETKHRKGEWAGLHNLGSVLEKQKQPELAIVFYKQAINVSESVRKGLKTLPRESQEIYISSVAIIYRRLANTLLSQGRTREAQSILELLKVEELQNFEKDQENKSAPIQFPIHPLESQALQTIEKSITSKQPLTLESLKTIGQPLSQNRDRITQDMNNSDIAIGNPKAILNANPNAILIQNLVVDEKFWVLWTNANGITKAILIPNVTPKQLEATVTEFREQIGSPKSDLDELEANSTKLYNWLIPPQLQTELAQNPKQQLIFSLDHVTRNIPVAALYDGKQYLIQRYTLSNIITTDINMSDRFTLEGQPTTILGLGTTKAYAPFKALANVEAELNAIVQTSTPNSNTNGIYPGKIQLNETFTAQSLQTNLDQYRILHIATHGVFDTTSITASYLLLGNGDRLPITDIAKLNNLTNTHLIVLSACQTGISGAGQDGTEISGISGYFLRRGAKSVLASLWSVNDASTALMMQQFYKTLSQTKLTKAEALQKIQQDFISGKLTIKEADAIPRTVTRGQTSGQTIVESLAHPYFWAPFVLTGNNL